MSVWYVTDEMLADSMALTGIANQAFAEEITFMLEDGIFEGSGAGMPLGITNAPALVVAAADKGQASKTLTYTNIGSMWARMWARSRKNAAWFINQDLESQLYSLSAVVGTGGQPVFLPAGPIGSQASGAPYATLYGRPVIPVEYAQTLGTQGDITLADFSQYVKASRAAMQQMTSIHVRFLTDETTFRLTYRVDGTPIWHAPLTPFHGTNTLSPFVQLAAR
jgi:HK97 family phage major capsid protein